MADHRVGLAGLRIPVAGAVLGALLASRGFWQAFLIVLLTVLPVWVVLAVETVGRLQEYIGRLRLAVVGVCFFLLLRFEPMVFLDLPGWMVVGWLAGLSRLVVPARMIRNPVLMNGFRLLFILLLRWLSLPLLFF